MFNVYEKKTLRMHPSRVITRDQIYLPFWDQKELFTWLRWRQTKYHAHQINVHDTVHVYMRQQTGSSFS